MRARYLALTWIAMFVVAVQPFGAAARAVTPAPAAIVCNSPLTGNPLVRRAPLTCTVLPPRASFSQGVNLVGLRWRSWGRPTAYAIGIDRGFHLPFAHIAARVTAFGLRPDFCHRRLYTSVRVTTAYGTRLAHPQRVCED